MDGAFGLDILVGRKRHDAVERHALAVVAKAMVLGTAGELTCGRHHDAGVAGPGRAADHRVGLVGGPRC